MLSFDKMPDESLMDFIRGGNARAFETLVNRHHRRFYQMVYRWVLHPEDAEDVVQHCFVKLWSGKARWKTGKKAKFTTWFYRILYNQSIDLLRSKQRSYVELNEAVLASGDNQERDAMTEQTNTRLLKVLAELPEKQRMAVQLFYFEDMKQKDIADVMGLGVKALESQLTRARQNLREQLGDEPLMEASYG